jgi:ferritin-like metal-binding protein YciE
MAVLDGLWSVERVGGFLPPLVGVRKRIAGSTGETTVAGLPGAPFAVEGLVLRYRAPLSGLTDVLEPEDDGYSGRTSYRGREIGKFRMRRIEERGEEMVSKELEARLSKHIDEAIAMEQTVLRMLDSMISTTKDEEIKEDLRLHKLETERQLDRLTRRLEARGSSPSLIKEAGGITGALLKGVVDAVRGEKAARNARDGYATEHLEIAAYQLLERIAQRAGDEETAEVARQNRAEEEAMAARIDANWDRYAELALEEAGITL